MKKRNSSLPLKATALYLVCSFLQKVIGVITIPIFTRVMDTEQYGIFSVFSSWLTVLTVFVSLNFGWEGIFNGFRDFKKDKEVLINSVQTMSVLITILYLIISLLFPDFLQNIFSLDIFYIRLMLLQLSVSGSYDMWCAKKRYEFKYKKFCVVTLIYTLFPVLTSLIVFAIPNTDNTASLRALVSTLSAFAIAGLLFLINSINAKFRIAIKYWKYAIVLNAPLIPHYLSRTLLNQLDHIMVNSLRGGKDAGKYSLAYSVGLLPNMLTLAINNALSPWIYRMIEAKKISRIRSVIRYIGVVLLFGVVSMMLLAPEIVRIFATEEYQEAIYVIPTIGASAYAIYLYTILSDIEIYYASTRIIMVGSIFATIFNFLSNYYFISKYGYIAAGYTTLASFYIILLTHFLQYRKIVKQTKMEFIDKRFSVLSLVAITVFALLCPYLYSMDWLRVSIFGGLIIVMIYKAKAIVDITKRVVRDYRIS